MSSVQHAPSLLINIVYLFLPSIVPLCLSSGVPLFVIVDLEWVRDPKATTEICCFNFFVNAVSICVKIYFEFWKKSICSSSTKVKLVFATSTWS